MNLKTFICGVSALTLMACGSDVEKLTVDIIQPATDCRQSQLKGYCEYVISADELVYGLLVSDLNGDNILDIFPHGHDSEDRAYLLPSLNETNGLNTPFDRHLCDASDIDQDGDADIFCAHGARKGEGGYGNFLSINTGNLNFEFKPPIGAEDKAGRGRVARFFNLNDDIHPDLVITNYADGNIADPVPSAVFKGLGNFEFEKIENIDLGNSGEMCAEKADWDGDGYEGFLLCDRQVDSRLYVNQRGQLINVTEPIKYAKSWTDAKVFDFNKDDYPDFVAVTKVGLLLVFENSGNADEPFSKPRIRLRLPKILKMEIEDNPLLRRRGAYQLGIFDANNDTHPDILVGTNYPISDGDFRGDFVFYGPDYKNYDSLGTVSSGTGHIAQYNMHSLVIARAGISWSGEVVLLTPAPDSTEP